MAARKEDKPDQAKKTTTKTTTKKTTTKNTKKIQSEPKQIGRPRKVDPDVLAHEALLYAHNSKFPIVAEFAHLHGITREYLYELAANEKAKGNDALSYGIKMISETKEIILEKGGLGGTLVPSMAIFSLKQLGWKDKTEEAISISTDDENQSGVIMIAPVLERDDING